MVIKFFPMLACCFQPSSAARRGGPEVVVRPDEAEKRRWVDEQVGLHLAARTWDGYGYSGGYGKGGAVDVSCYGDIGLEVALGYEFERRWWFAQTTRLLALVDDDDGGRKERGSPATRDGAEADIAPAAKAIVSSYPARAGR